MYYKEESCITDTNEEGLCVYSYQCHNGTVLMYGENSIDIRQSPDNCGAFYMKCCKYATTESTTSSSAPATDPTIVEEQLETGQTVSPGGAKTDGLKPSSEGASTGNWNVTDDDQPGVKQTTPSSERERNVTDGKPSTPPPVLVPSYEVEDCGHRNPHGVVFTIENDVHSESEYGEYPWTAAVFAREEDSSLKYLCGGALIEQSAILTTASCLYDYRLKKSQLVVRLGEWDISTDREPIPHVDSGVVSVHIHLSYGMTTKINDIAIAILQDTVELGHTIGVVCLPPAGSEPGRGNVIGTGWGYVPSFVVPQKLPQTILKKTYLRPLSHTSCEGTLGRQMGRRYKLHQSFLCAQDTVDSEMLPCRGDLGSPFVVEIDGGSDRFYLVGLSSWGYDCNKRNVPTVLTNVAYHREWIDEVIKQENLNKWSYTYVPKGSSSEE